MAISQELWDKFRTLWTDISVIFGVVIDSLSDEQSSKTDWDNGIQEGTPGTDFPTTTSSAILTLMGTTLTVVATDEFTIGDTDVGYLIITDGADTEIVSYDSSNATQFLNLVRGLYGTTQQSWASGIDVHQLVWSHGVLPEFDLEIQRKNYIQQNISGSNPSAREGAKLIFRPFDGNYYLFGGHDGATALNDLWKLDPTAQAWTQLTPTGGPPGIRKDFVMELFVGTAGADELWVNGGWDGGATRYKDTWKYSFSGNSWSTNAAWDLGKWRYQHQGIMWPGNDTEPQQLIITGGLLEPAAARTASTVKFDGSTLTGLGPAPHALAKGDAAYSNVFDCMIVTALDGGDGMRCDIYDPNLNGWTVAAVPPAKRYFPTLVSDTETGEALMFGGTLSLAAPANGRKNLYAFNKANNSWRELAEFSREGRKAHVAAWDSINNEMLIWGGRVNLTTFPVWPDPIKFRYFWQTAKFRTQTINLGSVPTTDGQWILEDIKDFTVRQLSNVAYTAEWSDDDIAWNPIGTVKDGDAITLFHRYWRVEVTLTSDGLNVSPSVQKIDANFDLIEWVSLANKPVDNFLPVIKNISSLATQVDPIKATSKIGTMTVELLNGSLWAQKLITNLFPRGKTVFVKVGIYEGGPFDEDDFTVAFKGKIKDWAFDGGVIRLKIEDFLGDFKKDIPEEDSGGVVTPLQYNAGGIAAHPVDIMEDIILNQLNIPDRNVDLDSFATVRSDPSLTDWAFNRIISSPEDGYKLLQEISRHIGAVIILKESGTLALKILSPSAQPVDDWDEKTQMFRNLRFSARANDTIRNFVSTWWGWDGDGDEVADYSGIEVITDADSVTNWGLKILRTKSKWLGSNANPYFGSQRAIDISTRILELGKNGIPAIRLETYLGAFPVNAGDMVRVQSSVVKSLIEYIKWQAKFNPQKDLVFVDATGRFSIPYLAFDVFECIDMKFYITKKQVDFTKGMIRWELHRAREVPLEQAFDTQAEWQQGTGQFIDFTTTPGSVLVDLGAIFEILDDCEVADWGQLNEATPEILNPTNFIHGSNSLDLGKNSGATDLAIYFKTLGFQLDGTGKPAFVWIYIADLNELRVSSAITVKIGNDVSNYYQVWFARSELSVGENKLGGSLSDDFTTVGSPDITKLDFLRLQIKTPTAGDSIPSGNVRMDFWHLGVEGFAAATYELIIDMTQQPERDGVWTIDDTIPADTSIIYEAWASETGDFQGEEMSIGAVVNTDPITLKARYYKIVATLTPSPGFTVTPSIDEIKITFNDG